MKMLVRIWIIVILLLSCNDNNMKDKQLDPLFNYYNSLLMISQISEENSSNDSVYNNLYESAKTLSLRIRNIKKLVIKEEDTLRKQWVEYIGYKDKTKFVLKEDKKLDSLFNKFLNESNSYLKLKKKFSGNDFYLIAEDFLEDLRQQEYINANEYSSFSLIVQSGFRNEN